MRWWSPCVALLAACGPDAVAWPDERPEPVFLDVPGGLTFGDTPLGDHQTTTVAVANLGPAGGAWSLRTQGPFTVDRTSVELGGGQALTLSVTFQPIGYAASTGALELVGGQTLALSGTTQTDADGDGVDAAGAGGTDCDDAAPEVHPGAAEICGDGVDQDCALGGETDCDADGAPAPADCDDTDPTVGPEANETVNDRDDDCDGLVDESELSAGDLVIAEISPQDPAWVELCSVATATVHLDGLTLMSTAGPVELPAASLEPGACAAICASAIADCAAEAPITLGGDTDRLVVSAGSLVLDAVAWDPGFGWIPGRSLALDPGHLDADRNNVPSAWCVVGGTPGELNAPCE